MLREKRSLRCWREAQSPAHPSGGTSLWIRGRLPMDHTSPAAEREGGGSRVSGTGSCRRESRALGAAGSRRGWHHLPLAVTGAVFWVAEVAEALCTRLRGSFCGSNSFLGVSAHPHSSGVPQNGTTAAPQRPHAGLGSEREMKQEAERRGVYPNDPRAPLPPGRSAEGSVRARSEPLPLQPLPTVPCEGTQFWGTSHLATSLLAAPPDAWHSWNVEGREGTLKPIPLTLSWGRPARFQAAHAVPGLGAIPQRGRVFAAGSPGKINAPGPASQHGSGIAGAWPRCLLSAQPRGAAALNANICVGSRKKNKTNNK